MRHSSGERQRRGHAIALGGIVTIGVLAALGAGSPSGGARAQDAPAKPAPGIADLDDGALLARAGVLAARLADAERACGAEAKALAAGQGLLDDKRAQVARLALPADAPPPAGATPASAAKLAQDGAAARLDVARLRERIVADQKSLLDDRAKHLETMRSALDALGAAIDEADPVSSELALRVAAGRLQGDKLPAAVTTRAVTERRERRAVAESAWRKDSEQTAESLRAVPARLAALQGEVKDAEAKLAAATRRARELLRREAFEKEIAEKDASTLIALLSTLSVERDRLAESLEPARVAFERARSDVTAAEAEVQARATPDAATVPVDPGPARVVSAQRTVNLVAAIADYQRQRAERLRRLEGALVVLAERADALAKGAADLDDALLRTSVVTEAVDRLRDAGKPRPDDRPASDARPDGLADERRKASETRDRAESAAAEARGRVPRIEGEIAEAAGVEKAQRQRIEPLRSAFERAKTAASWTSDVEKLPAAEVVRSFLEAREQTRAAEAAIAKARVELAAAEGAVTTATVALDAIDDPISRRLRRQNEAERSRILAALYKAAGREPPVDRSLADGAAPLLDKADPLASPEVDLGTVQDSKGSAGLAARIEARETVLVARAEAFDARLHALEVLALQHVRAETAAGGLILALNDAMRAAQRAYGAALELETRAGIGEMPIDKLPPDVADAGAHDRLAALEADLAAAQAKAAALRLARDRLKKAHDDDERPSRDLLALAISIAGKMADILRERALREASYEPAAPATSDVDRKRRTQEIVRRVEADDSTTETVLGLFTNERAEELLDILRSDYGDLIELQRKSENLVARSRLTTDLLAQVGDDAAVVASWLPVARTRLGHLRAEDAALRVRRGIVSPTDPSALADLAADGLAPPLPEPVVAGDLAALADHIFAVHARSLAAESLVRDLEHRLSPGGLDQDRGARQEELGALSARLDALKREETRIQAEVAQTREVRSAVLVRAALASLVRLVLVPLVAFVLTRLVHALGRHIVKRIHEDPSEISAEREQWAQTVVNVFSRAASSVIVAVAAIYMLKELKIDVTPIIASAGVVGLALAFGAQALVRDYFAGFFILLENQYKIGDTVKIGDSTGIVERVSLRLTVLRADDGTVFYIPNGNVQLVANLSKGWAITELKIEVGYEADLDRVAAVLREVGNELNSDELLGGKILEAPQYLGIEEFGENGITVSMIFRTLPNEQLVIVREARNRIKKAFDREKIPRADPPPDPVRHVYPPERPPPPATP